MVRDRKLGRELRRERDRRGLSQKQVAAELNVHLNTLSGWERIGVPKGPARSVVKEWVEKDDE